MTRQIQAGTITAGTLRTEDLLDAFATELDNLVRHSQKILQLKTPLGIAYADWSRIIAHKRLISDAKAARLRIQIEGWLDGSWDESEASEIVNELQDALNEYAPDNMYFGTLEGDGADFGWWYIECEWVISDEVTA